VAPDIDGLQSLANEFELLLIEDNAHGLGGSYKGKPLGSFGDFATQSFHATKNIQCGEGGAFVINNPKFIERAEIIREKGTDRSKFIRGEVQKYEWVDQGSSYLLAEVLAAQLTGELESFKEIQLRRKDLLNRYEKLFHEFPNRHFSPQRLDRSENVVAHMFYIEFGDMVMREDLRHTLLQNHIITTSHYQPLDLSKMGYKTSKSPGACQNSKKFAENILRFPMWVGLEDSKLFDLLKEKLIPEFLSRMSNK
jgi:dTDP-4-amino-4,6-dideoxygalactose transaminase